MINKQKDQVIKNMTKAVLKIYRMRNDVKSKKFLSIEQALH